MIKNILFLSFILLLIFIISCKNSVVETQVHVWGVCDIAKRKIDSAAKLNGVIHADWNVDSKLLTLKYDSTKITLDDILKNIAMSGFDNERYFADDYAYEQLPDNCKYERREE
ncbi:MAG: copper chaperone [Bacteroidetes bacterium]|nr:MAG: copper chaperone [Bacteroidota bacterium]